MENTIFELQYAMDTFYFLVCGALVMWMAAGFAMLESGLVRLARSDIPRPCPLPLQRAFRMAQVRTAFRP